MKISMDKKYRTRDGRDVRLLCVDGPEEYPVIGITDGSQSPCSWTIEGNWISAEEADEDDLIEYHEPDIRTIWVNVYHDFVSGHREKEEAEWHAGQNCIAIAQPVTFEVKRS